MAAACALAEVPDIGHTTTVSVQAPTDTVVNGEIEESDKVNEAESEINVQPVSNTPVINNSLSFYQEIDHVKNSKDSQQLGNDEQTESNNDESIVSESSSSVSQSDDKNSKDSDSKLHMEVAVQANDYDIERRSGRIPARRRMIPFKFRDYKNPDLVNENGTDTDSDYEPDDEEMKYKRKRKQTFSKSPRGRPRKYPNIKEIMAIVDKTNAGGNKSQEGENVENSKNATEDILGDGNDVIPGDKGDVTEMHMRIIKVVHSSDETTDISEQGQVNEEDTSQVTKDVEKQQNIVVAKATKDVSKSSHGFQCSECSKIFSTKGNLKTHLRIHTGERPFLCDIKDCGKAYRSMESLRRHRLSHMGIKQFECTFCERKFSSNVSLQEHISLHTGNKPYQCHICLRNFRQISCLRRHLVTHSSETPYTCTICGRKFTQTIYLRSHMKVHTGERPFKCQVENCGKAFAHQSDLTRHKIVHTGLKPYICDVCGTRFSDPSSRRRHEREHVGIKPYPCQLCGESFKRAGQLKAHLGRKHTNEQGDVQIVRSSNGALLFLFKDKNKEGTGIIEDLSVDKESLVKQKKIVKLIQDLNSSMVQHVQINLPPQHDYSASSEPVLKNLDEVTEVVEGETIYLDASSVEQQQALEETIQAEIIQNLPVSETETTTQSIPELVSGYHNVEVQSEQSTDGATVIAIAEVDEQGQPTTSVPVPVEYLQIIEELAPDSLEQQIVEVHYQQAEEVQEEAEKEVPEKSQEQESEQPSASSTSSSCDFVANPDFNCQEYYNWLSSFTELCKVVPMPLDMSLFQKISQVHKTLSDVMATPTGVVADKENFKILMNISKDLNTIINEHLCFVMQNLDPEKGE